MKLKDIKISTRLTLGFGISVFLVMILGYISFNQASRLWQNTDDLYNHPYQVGRTVRDIQIGVLEIHRKMKDIAMDEGLTLEQIDKMVHAIDSIEVKVYENYGMVKQLYLGPKEDIDKSYMSFSSWKRVRDNLINIRLKSGRDESYKTYIIVNRVFINSMLPEIDKLIQFSSAKGESFYKQAGIEKDKLFVRFIVLILVIVISTVLITFLLIKAIRTPLRNLTAVTDEYSMGNYSVRSDYVSENEFGTLASAFNKMASSVQNDIIIKENVAWVTHLLMNEYELKPFCSSLIHALLAKTESQVAAIYILNSNSGKFEHYDSAGLAEDRIRNFSSYAGEGEFGTLLSQKKILHISDIPDDTYFSFSTITGNFKPREIVSIPIIDQNVVIAAISLATLKNYSELSIRLLNDIQLIVTARLLGVLHFQKTKDFSSVLDQQNMELEQKSKELSMQSDEMREYNIELEQQKKQLDEANKLKSTFLSNMSHELRTPLNSVIALSGVLNRRLEGKIPEDEYNYLGIIEKNGKNLLSLINDILDLSRIEAGKEEIALDSFSISELLNDILNSIVPLAESKGLSIACSASVNLPSIISDRAKCHHIFQNIISNAVKFTESGTVKISASVKGENLTVSIIDTGIGIPEEFKPYLFDEFRQADDRFSRKFGGTGLGLAIVKKYCQLLDGSIDVKSNHGSGSEFIVTLPIKPEDFKAEPDISDHIHKPRPSLRQDSKEKRGSGKTILLVDDSEPQIIQLTDILKEEGFGIQVARNGREALDSVKQVIPDAMILDLQMPDVDGFEVLKEIRNLDGTKSIPILILTAKHISKAELGFLKENHVYQLIQKGGVSRIELLEHVYNLVNPDRKSVDKPVKKEKSKFTNDSKPSILVIEDNEDNLITVRALLEEKFIITAATDGNSGYENALTILPDLILLDISLPGTDGFTVFDEIKKNKALSDIPVIALTARAMKGDRENLLAYGFDGYISKPIDNETFEIKIREYLNY